MSIKFKIQTTLFKLFHSMEYKVKLSIKNIQLLCIFALDKTDMFKKQKNTLYSKQF